MKDSNSSRQDHSDKEMLIDTPVLEGKYQTSEVVIAFVGAVGVDLHSVEAAVTDRLRTIGYSVEKIHITRDVIPLVQPTAASQNENEYQRISRLMDAGNTAREVANDGILAAGTASQIALRRAQSRSQGRVAYLIHSLKHPAEVRLLREIYPRGLYLVGVHAIRDRRIRFLMDKSMTKEEAKELMRRDMNEDLPHGQRIVDTFHLADFFVRIEGNNDRLKNSLWRMIDIIFGDPHRTPNFGEYAMFLAFAASLRSADLSRQVGAVIARNGEILGTGANDCPKAGGGLYWPTFDPVDQTIKDAEGGRDWTRGIDSNKDEQKQMIDEIASELQKAHQFDAEKVKAVLNRSSIRHLTEFGRVVHAEMEALLSCARNRTDTRAATMYCTTFPCHNCAKHIIAAGIERVVFIEPYQKSKAIKLHNDAIEIGIAQPGYPGNKVTFEAFVGVGPRRFFDLFSTQTGIGYPLRRKAPDGEAVKWSPENAMLRIQMLPRSYLQLESEAANDFQTVCARTIRGGKNGKKISKKKS